MRIPLSNCSICMVWEIFPLPLPGKLAPAGRLHSWASDSLIWPLFFFFPWLLSLVHRASEQGFLSAVLFFFWLLYPIPLESFSREAVVTAKILALEKKPSFKASCFLLPCSKSRAFHWELGDVGSGFSALVPKQWVLCCRKSGAHGQLPFQVAVWPRVLML